jgi:addiction module HigA family antidote
MARKLPNIHPGEVLREEFLGPMGLSAYVVAKACGVPRTRIERLARGEAPITADTALRLATYFGVSPELWLNLQADYDLRVIKRTRGEEIERRVRKRPAA